MLTGIAAGSPFRLNIASPRVPHAFALDVRTLIREPVSQYDIWPATRLDTGEHLGPIDKRLAQPNANKRGLTWIAVLLKRHDTGEAIQRVGPLDMALSPHFQSWLPFKNA